MNIAFYAPLKPPDHPHPSGDRRIARLFMSALRAGGHDVHVASRFRAREARGDGARQRRLAEVGRKLALRYVRNMREQPASARPALWFSYHLYYKAPDWIGPVVARALGIPYVVAEASYAPKRDRPPWTMVHHAAGAAIGEAAAIITLNSDDVGCLLPLLHGDTSRIHRLRPFIDIEALAIPAANGERKRAQALNTQLDPDKPWLITAAMMRPGDKQASFEMLAQCLAQLQHHPWQLVVLGDGEARGAVEQAFAPLAARVHWAGLCDTPALVGWLSCADLYVWPAVNEAFGMAFLEAQACGLPVVAARTRGVPDVVAHDTTGVLTELHADALANGVEQLLLDVCRREQMGRAARRYARQTHDIGAASRALDVLLEDVVEKHR